MPSPYRYIKRLGHYLQGRHRKHHQVFLKNYHCVLSYVRIVERCFIVIIVSLELNDQQIKQLKESLSQFDDVIPPQYANFRVSEPGLNITIYNNAESCFSRCTCLNTGRVLQT